MTGQNVALKGKIDTVRDALTLMKPQLAMALPKHLTPERLLRVTMTAVQNTPRLLDCDRTSLFAAVMTCAQLGLEPDGVLGQAYLVPYGNKVQFIPGYKGYLALARNSGEISTIQAHEVHENDFFEYAYGLVEKLEHRPADGERGKIKYFYAYALYKDGGHIFEVMTVADVNAIRDKSYGYKAFIAKKIKSNPWDSSYPQMGRKTAIRRLANYLPLNVQRAAALDGAAAAGKFASTDDFGEVVIESQAEEVAIADQPVESSATQRLDQLAGDAKEPAKGEMIGDPPDLTDQTPADDKPPTMTELIKSIDSADTVELVLECVDLARGLKREDWRKKVNDAGRDRIAVLQLPAHDPTKTAAKNPAKAVGDGGLFGEGSD